MFSFRKKGAGSSGGNGNASTSAADKEEKERRKKEKKERKEKEKKEKCSMTADDLLRLDEVRRSLKLRSKRKDKEKEKLPSGITADYSANFFGDMSRDPLTQTNVNGFSMSLSLDSPVDNFEVASSFTTAQTASTTQQQIQQRALPLPPLPPRAPKKVNSKSSLRHSFSSEGVDPLTYKNITADSSSYQSARSSSLRTASSTALNEDTVDFKMESAEPPLVYVSNYDKQTKKSPSIESLTDSTTNSSFATPPFSSSPVGEGQGYYSKFATVLLGSSPEDAASEFPLPDIEPVSLPKAREIVISRKSTPKNDFGFSLRRVMTVNRIGGMCQLNTVILAEMNAVEQSADEIGLLPGDQLLEVNEISVKDKTREEIIELIKSSENSVKIKVQPLPELSELSRRYRSDGTTIELDDTNIKSGTLRRSGSKRFKQSKGSTRSEDKN